MNYKELKKIAEPHIRKGEILPSNALLLLTQLHIPYKTEKQCEEDFNGKYNPLDNHPAFLSIKNGEKTLYFKTSTRYYNFYIFHEIAHYILGHETNSPEHEMDANMLACILAAPIENFPTTIIKTAEDLSSLCQIPIDRAEEYWGEIKNKIPQKQKIIKHISFIICLIAITILSTSYIIKNDERLKPSDTVSKLLNNISPITNMDELTINQTQVTVTVSGKKYHLATCSYLKNKNNLSELDINKAIEKGYEPCSRCFP